MVPSHWLGRARRVATVASNGAYASGRGYTSAGPCPLTCLLILKTGHRLSTNTSGGPFVYVHLTQDDSVLMPSFNRAGRAWCVTGDWKEEIMANSTLYNLKNSAFVRTPPDLAVRIGRNLLSLPEESFNVFDPTSGEGDFLYACAHVRSACYFGVEISAERAAVSRQRFPTATILTSAFEGVHIPPASMDLVLANPPYFFVDGKRAEYRVITDAGEALVPGGILVAILPARSAWDGTMVNHWLKWYERIRVWKFPDRVSKEEGAFEDFTQIVVVGVRRMNPAVPDAAEKKRLAGYHWNEPEKVGQSGWKQGMPPSALPEVPIADPYHVPTCRAVPQLVVRRADEATLLYALD